MNGTKQAKATRVNKEHFCYAIVKVYLRVPLPKPASLLDDGETSEIVHEYIDTDAAVKALLTTEANTEGGSLWKVTPYTTESDTCGVIGSVFVETYDEDWNELEIP